MGGLFTYIFDGISDKYKHELNLIAQQYPVEPLKYLRPSLRITFEEGITMLRVSCLLRRVVSSGFLFDRLILSILSMLV